MIADQELARARAAGPGLAFPRPVTPSKQAVDGLAKWRLPIIAGAAATGLTFFLTRRLRAYVSNMSVDASDSDRLREETRDLPQSAFALWVVLVVRGFTESRGQTLGGRPLSHCPPCGRSDPSGATTGSHHRPFHALCSRGCTVRRASRARATTSGSFSVVADCTMPATS